MTFFQKQRASSVLGLAFDGARIEGVVLRRTNGSLQVQKTFAGALSQLPFSGDPEVLGREIRAHLDGAGIRERRCVVALPLGSALSMVIQVPELPEADVASFLEIEAERSFPYGQEALLTSTARFQSAGKRQATLVAFQRSELSALEKALRGAQLKPLSFSLGIAAVQKPESASSNGALALMIGGNSVDLQVTVDGGIVSLRSLDGAFGVEGSEKSISSDLLAREVRITLGQLPEAFRSSVRTVRIFGSGDLVRRLVNEFTPRAQALGLQVECVGQYAAQEYARKIPVNTPVSPAFSVAARYLSGETTAFEFLPPRVKPWQQLATRFSSGKLVWAGGTAGAAAAVVGGAFLFQQWQLSHLSSQWTRMSSNVAELEDLQQQIRKYRPWYDETLASLIILRKVTEAFPAEGVVTAKTLEIRELSSVTCSGTASDNQALLRVLDQLRASREVSNLKVDQVRGKTPMQFTFNFQWGDGGGQP